MSWLDRKQESALTSMLQGPNSSAMGEGSGQAGPPGTTNALCVVPDSAVPLDIGSF